MNWDQHLYAPYIFSSTHFCKLYILYVYFFSLWERGWTLTLPFAISSYSCVLRPGVSQPFSRTDRGIVSAVWLHHLFVLRWAMIQSSIQSLRDPRSEACRYIISPRFFRQPWNILSVLLEPFSSHLKAKGNEFWQLRNNRVSVWMIRMWTVVVRRHLPTF